MRLFSLLALILCGCISETQVDRSYPINPDPRKLDAVEPGRTKQAEILEWFGPPQFVYDGDEQKLIEGDAHGLEGIVAEGMVALGYYNHQMEFDSSTSRSPEGMEHVYRESVVSKEKILFIVSKKDEIVRKLLRPPRQIPCSTEN